MGVLAFDVKIRLQHVKGQPAEVTAEAAGDEGPQHIGGPVVEREKAKGLGVLGGLAVEEGGSFAKRARGAASSEVAKEPSRDRSGDETNEQEAVIFIGIERKAHRCGQGADDDEEKEETPEKRRPVEVLVGKGTCSLLKGELAWRL